MSEKDGISRSIGRREILRTLGISGAVLMGGAGSSIGAIGDGLTTKEEKRAKRLLARVERAPNPDAVWRQMSNADLKLVQKATTVREVTLNQHESTGEDDDVSIAAVGCKTITSELVGKSYLGKQWGYFLETDFCYDGSTVTSFDHRRWPQIYGVSWSFVGHIDLKNDDSTGTSHCSVWTQGEFKSDALGMDFDHAYPWIDHDVYGSGTYNATGNHGECNNC